MEGESNGQHQTHETAHTPFTGPGTTALSHAWDYTFER